MLPGAWIAISLILVEDYEIVELIVAIHFCRPAKEFAPTEHCTGEILRRVHENNGNTESLL